LILSVGEQAAGLPAAIGEEKGQTERHTQAHHPPNWTFIQLELNFIDHLGGLFVNRLETVPVSPALKRSFKLPVG